LLSNDLIDIPVHDLRWLRTHMSDHYTRPFLARFSAVIMPRFWDFPHPIQRVIVQ
jgi:hypothetical protein